ncbi:MAG: glycosyltransferase family 4 protein [Verrucomicrobiota bacterium]
MKSLLYLCPFRLLPIRGGGALRAFHLIRQLARFYEVHAVLWQPEAELRVGVEGYCIPETVRVYSPQDQPPPRSWFHRLPPRLGPALQYRCLRRSWRGPANSVLLSSHHFIKRILRERPIHAVVFDELDAVSCAPLVRRWAPAARQVFNAYNVNHRLLGQALRASGRQPEDSPDWRRVRWAEHNLRRFVDGIFACSELDRQAFVECSGLPSFTVPNGVDTRFFQFDDRAEKAQSRTLLFTGSLQYPPNADGLGFFLDEIWPRLTEQLPGIEFLVAGAGAGAELRGRLERTPQVRFAGEVPDMRPLARRAGVAVCPLRIGSGTRLKILEYMSWGTPVVSTSQGAEGLEAQDGEHLLLADEPEPFIQAVLRLLNDQPLFDSMRHAARHFVEQRYDWDIIGNMANRALEDLWEKTEVGGQRLGV